MTNPRLSYQDLSLLVDLSYSDLQKLQELGSATQAEQAKFILRNDLEKVWATIKDVKDGRVDIVLDNGGLQRLNGYDWPEVSSVFLLQYKQLVSRLVLRGSWSAMSWQP